MSRSAHEYAIYAMLDMPASTTMSSGKVLGFYATSRMRVNGFVIVSVYETNF